MPKKKLSAREMGAEMGRITSTLCRDQEAFTALLVVTLRKDGSYDVGAVVSAEDFPTLVEATGAALRRVKADFSRRDTVARSQVTN